MSLFARVSKIGNCWYIYGRFNHYIYLCELLTFHCNSYQRNSDTNEDNNCIQPYVSFESLLWNAISGSSYYKERKCSECNNDNFVKKIIFNGEVQVIKVFHLLRACDTNQKLNRLKVQIPFEVDLKSCLPYFANASDSIYILFAAINFYGPTVISGHYICHLFTKNYEKLYDDKTFTTKATKTVLGDQ